MLFFFNIFSFLDLKHSKRKHLIKYLVPINAFYFPGYGVSPFTSNGQQAKPNPNGTAVPFTLYYITLYYINWAQC